MDILQVIAGLSQSYESAVCNLDLDPAPTLTITLDEAEVILRALDNHRSVLAYLNCAIEAAL